MEETSTTSNRQRLKSGEIKKKPAGRGRYRRNFRVEIANPYKDDGYAWKRYAQTKILHAKFYFNRYYYRCAHEGCGALRHVQKLEDGSERFHITYAGSHTCQNMNENTLMLFSDLKIPPERSFLCNIRRKTAFKTRFI